MANKIKEIKGFFSGIVSSFSSSDIKDDAASYSVNIDSTDEDGLLKGSKSDSLKIGEDTIKSSIATNIENSDNTFDLVFSDLDTGKLNVVKDLYNSPKIVEPTNVSEPGTVVSSIETKNNQVFAGYGQNSKPKILYKTKHIPFAESQPNESNWIYEDSTVYDERLLNSSFNVDRFVALPGSSSALSKDAVGIRYDHKDIYFIKFDAGFTSEDVYDFSANPAEIDIGDANNKLLGGACDICQADIQDYVSTFESADDGSVSDVPYKFWVLSNSGGDTEDTNSFPILQKFEYTNLFTSGSPQVTQIGQAYTINFQEGNPPTGSAPASIIETKNYLWIQYWKPSKDSFARTENFLWCINLDDGFVGTEANAVNKSVKYDYIKRKSATFRLKWTNFNSQQYKETYFRNDDMPYHNLNNDDWLSGNSGWGWGQNYFPRGNHYRSGLLSGDGYSAPSLKIARHGLITSPLTNTVAGETENIDSQVDEDWISVFVQTDENTLVNIYTAQEHKVDGGFWHDDYRKLRAADDDGGGSDILEDNYTNWYDSLNPLTILIAIFFPPILLFEFMGNTANHILNILYGPDDVNWFYNGKCFESGSIKNAVLNISSNHNPQDKLDTVNGGARLQFRELFGFDDSYEVICVKHYFNRLMISTYNPSEEDDLQKTKFFTYNTSEHSLTETNPLNVRVIHTEDLEEIVDGDVEVPSEYLAEGNTKNELGNEAYGEPVPNQVLQQYHPVVDFDINSIGSFDFNDNESLDQIYPHLYTDFWNTEDNNLALNINNLANSNTVGKIYSTERAVFDIFLRKDAYYNGKRIVNASPGWSSQTAINDHIGFLSTSGPLNVSKFNFLVVLGNDNDTDLSQQNLPDNPNDLFPNNNKSILSLNQYPNTSDDINIKQYSLDTKSLSFKVKAQIYDGVLTGPFIYSAAEGQQNLYRYKINLVYDGYQDSPLSNHYTEVDIRDVNVRDTANWSSTGGNYAVGDIVNHSTSTYECITAHTPTASSGQTNSAPTDSSQTVWKENKDYQASSLAVTINLHKPEIISRRITSVRLWRSTINVHESDTETDTFNIEGQYTLVDTIPLKANWAVSEEGVPGYNSDTNIDLGKVANYTVIDNGTVGPSYEASVGLPEAMKLTLPNYTLSTQLNGFLYIANCKHPSFENASSLIFRSLPDKYSMFDWTENYLALPSKPRALTSFNGRLIAWDYDNMYVINPDGFYIEDTFEGSGCLGSQSFARNEQGLCFADNNNIYLYDGRNISNIGIPVITNNNYSQEVSWRTRTKDYESIIKYNSVIRAFCLFVKLDRILPSNWLASSFTADKYYGPEDQANNTPIYRWYDITGILTYWDQSEIQSRYIVHENMYNAWTDEDIDYIPQDQIGNEEDFFKDYEFDGIVLPYGTAYDKTTNRYIVDVPSFLYGLGKISQEQQSEADEAISNVYVLEENRFPNSEDLFDEYGNLIQELPDAYYCFTYNVDKKRWDLQKTNKYKGAFNGPEGELYSSQLKDETEDSFVLKELFKNDSRKQFEYTSKNFSLSNQTVNKILSKIKIFYKGSKPELKYMINNDNNWIVANQENITYENYCASYKFPKEYKKVKTIKIKLISGYNNRVLSYDTEIDSFSIIYRERGNV